MNPMSRSVQELSPLKDEADAQVEQLSARVLELEKQLSECQRDLHRLNTLRSLVEAMSSELNLSSLLHTIIVSAVELLNAEQGAIGLVDEARHILRHRAVHNLPEALLDVEFAEGVGISGQVFALRRPVIVRDYGRQVQLPIDDDGMRRIRAAVSVPIWWKERFIGVFSIGTSDPEHIFHQDDIELLSLFAKHAAIAIENARLYGQTERLAHLEERHRIARELHDSITQSLFTIVLMSDAVRNYLRSGQTHPGPTAELLYETARDALTEMRALIYELRPGPLEGEGLVTALRKLANAIQTRHGLAVQVRQQGVRKISPEREEALFRIAQEALNNVVKHAHASHALVELRLTKTEAHLIVRDDGIGLGESDLPVTLGKAISHGGLGLTTMRERAEQLNGCLSVSSRPQHGTQVEARVPLTQEAGHGSDPGTHR